MRRLIAASFAALALSGEAAAETIASFLCREPQGITYGLPNAGEHAGFVEDGLSGGFMRITVGDHFPGGADISYRDAAGRFVSHAERGGTVHLVGVSEVEMTFRVDAYDPNNPLDSFTYLITDAFTPNAKLTYVQITPTTGFIPRVSIFSADCERIQ